MCMMETWLREKCQRVDVTRALPTTPSQYLPRDPMRWLVTIPVHSTLYTFVSFSDSSAALVQFLVGPGAYMASFSVDEIGELVTYPVWAWGSAAGGALDTVTGLSYLPERKLLYDAWVHRQLEKIY